MIVNSENEASYPPGVYIDQSQLQVLALFFQYNLELVGIPRPPDELTNHPPAKHPLVIEFYVLTILHQFGFWELDGSTYKGPWYGLHQGARLRGSDFVWTRMMWLLAEQPATFFLDGRIAEEPIECFALIDDECNQPPLWSQHLELSSRLRSYLKGESLSKIINRVRQRSDLNQGFLEEFGQIPGYYEDPFCKKLHLLMMYLSARTDNPLKLSLESIQTPAVDYHIMRFLLRFGVIFITDKEMATLLSRRQLISGDQEQKVRETAVKAVAYLTALTGLPAYTVDQLLFAFRKFCNDLPAGPECGVCPAAAVCARRVTLFQPLVRSDWY